MNEQTRRWLRFAIGIALSIILLYFAFRGTDLDSLRSAMAGANYWWILLMFVLLVASHIVRAWRWRYLLEPMKQGIGMRNLTSGVMVGYMMNNLVPRAGELVRPYTIAKLEGIPASAAFGTIVVERLIDTIAFLLLVALMPIVYSGPLRETFPWLDDARVIVSFATFGMVAGLLLLVVKRSWADAVVRLASVVLPDRFAKKLSEILHSFLDGFLFLRRPRHFVLIAIQSALVWLLYIAMIYVAFFAFSLALDFKAAIVIQAISAIGVAVPTPGGTGSYHVLASQALNKLFNVPAEIALSYVTVTHGFGFIGITIIGLYFFFKDHIRVADAVSAPVKNTA